MKYCECHTPGFEEVIERRFEQAKALYRSPLFQAVMDDLDARDAKGKREHNKYLRASDNLDWLQEAYEEALDMCVYLKGALLSRKETPNVR